MVYNVMLRKYLGTYEAKHNAIVRDGQSNQTGYN